MPLSPDSSRTTSTSSDFLPKSGPDLGTRNVTTIPSGLTKTPQGSDLQAKANDNIAEEDNGMGSQMSPMTTAITLQVVGTNTAFIFHVSDFV